MLLPDDDGRLPKHVGGNKYVIYIYIYIYALYEQVVGFVIESNIMCCME